MEKRVRVQVIVVHEDRILMIKVHDQGQEFFCLPGGGLESGETHEQGALRELAEECNVHGRIIRQTSYWFYPPIDETFTFLVDIQDQVPSMGSDPEADALGLPQAIVGLNWMHLHEIPERDRTFLWSAGLLGVGRFWSEVEAWGNEVSYP